MSRRWVQIRPKSSGADLGTGLQARIADPAWLLCRQWQTGEFKGEDAGTPAWVELRAEVARVGEWRAAGGSWAPVSDAIPLERQLFAEPAPFADLETRAELGRMVELALVDQGLPLEAEELQPLRARCTFRRPDAAERARLSASELSFRRLVAGRLDGGPLIDLARAASDPDQLLASLIDAFALQPSVAMALREAVAQVWGQVQPLHAGQPGPPATWRPERLEHEVELRTATRATDAKQTILRGRPDETGDLEWHAVEIQQSGEPIFERRETERLVPQQVRFAGMPNHRWWDLEDSASALAGMELASERLGHAVFLDFMLVAGNDWFLLPVAVPPGHLARVGVLKVRDVFGITTSVDRTERYSDHLVGSETPRARWTMFTTPIARAPGQEGLQQPDLVDWLFVPHDTTTQHLDGPTLEQVDLARDELANLAWAVESTLQDALGRPRPGRELAPAPRGLPGLETGAGSTWAYRVQTPVPTHWTPLVPVHAKGQTAFSGQIELRRARLWAQDRAEPSRALGRILNAQDSDYRIAEEELPREGLCLTRSVARARGRDGATHTWVRWLRRAGRGETASGLRYDILEPDR